jgi:hypothetical protein
MANAKTDEGLVFIVAFYADANFVVSFGESGANNCTKVHII